MAEGKTTAGTAAAAAIGYVPRPFAPARWLPGAHAQTLGGRLLRRPRPPAFRRERWPSPDGDFVDLDFAPFDGARAHSHTETHAHPHPHPHPYTHSQTHPHPERADSGDRAPIVLVLHGLEGSARRGYAIHTYDELARRGMRGVGLNFRSCSGEPNRTARFYHSGETDDIRFVVDGLRVRYPGVPVGAVGFSLGGNALIKYLAEEAAAGRAPVSAAAAISVPYDLDAGASHLDASWMGRLYTGFFVRSLVAKAEAKALLLEGLCDLERIRRARTFREFDAAATAPLHGFASAEDYYARCSSRSFLGAVQTPLLLLHAADDPLMPPRVFPEAAVAANPYVTAVLTERGGHVGFVAGPPWRPRFWAEEEAARFLQRVLAPLDSAAPTE